MTKSRAVFLATAVFALVFLLGPGVARAAVLELDSVSSAGTQGDAWATVPSISADGRYVAFQSGASNLVAGDTNNAEDIFVRDRVTGQVTRVSVDSNGNQADGESFSCWISKDAVWVSFASRATNLDVETPDTNGFADVYIHNRTTGATTRVSVSTGGAQGDGDSIYSCISGDGSTVAFVSDAATLVTGDANGMADVFAHDLATGATERVSLSDGDTEGNDDCFWVALNHDAQYVVFSSWATNLVAGDTNLSEDIFVRDRSTGSTTRVSVASSGAEGNDSSDFPAISADGRYVAFDSVATNLVATDINEQWDVFLHDRDTGQTRMLSVNEDGGQGEPPDPGFLSESYNYWPSMSADGRYVAFESNADYLVPWDTNANAEVFVVDTWTGAVSDVAVTPDWSDTDGDSMGACISADGRTIVFSSVATNLVPGDSNLAEDVFTAVNHLTLEYSSYRGSDRYFTALMLSQAAFPDPLPDGSGVVLAPGTTFPEALCGAPLATAYGGPVLLTPTTGLHPNVRTELQRLQPDRVFVIGLSATIATNVRTALPGATVTSIGTTGGNIYTMSRNVAKALGARVNATGGDISQAVGLVTIGTKFVDALGLGPLACAQKWPIVLTHQTSGALHAEAVATFTDLGMHEMIKVGTYSGPPAGVVSIANLSGVAPAGLSHLARYYTNANIANWALANTGLSFTHTAFATGDKFPDALASGPYLVQDLGILLVSPLNGPVPQVIRDTLAANAASVYHITYIACIEPVINTTLKLLP